METKICPHCKNNINYLNKAIYANHVRWCIENPNKIKYKRRKKRFCVICNKEHFTRNKTCSKQCEKILRKNVSKETREKMSKARKKFLKENKNKHNWSLYKNEETKPEKIFKEKLKKANIKYEIFQYYMPENIDRNYEIDFAIPDIKIGYEINGNQHYNDNGDLLEYYQNRHDYLEKHGWKMIEIPYLLVFNENKIKKIIEDPLNSNFIIESEKSKIIDYRNFKKEQIKLKNLKLEKKKKKKQEEKENLIKKRLNDIKNIDINKFGWVKILQDKWKISHSQVKRWIRKYYPNLNYYQRRGVSECPSKA